MIDQQKIYSFTRCSYYTNHFEDLFPFDIKYNIFNEVLKKVFVTHLKNQSYDHIESAAYRLMLELYKDSKTESDLLPQQIRKTLNSYSLILSRILNIIKIHSKIPVFGPTRHYYSHNGVNLKLYSSALYRDMDGAYWSYYLSPYTNSFQVKNDPIPYILWSLLNEFISQTLSKDIELTLKVIYIKSNNELDFEEIFSYEKKAFSNINSIIENINLKIPQYNCREKCKYKNRCNI